MRIMIPNAHHPTFYPPLAKEIGLASSVVLLTLEAEISEYGMDTPSGKKVARDNKQLARLLPWLTTAGIKEELKALQDKNFLYIEDASLLTKDTTKWLSLNWVKIKTLESIVVLGDGDIEDAHEAILPEENTSKSNGDGKLSQLHRALMPVVIKMSNFNTPLIPRDAAEAQRFIKNIIKKYPDEEFERLQKRILGIRVWQESRIKIGDKLSAPRPDNAWSNWGKYADFCRERYNGNLPPIPGEWIRETGRKQ